MSDQTVVPGTPSSEAAEGTPAVIDAPVPAALLDIDPDKMAEIRERIKRFQQSRGTTVSGSEEPDQGPKTTPDGNPIAETMTGKDVDWSEYDLDYNLRHLYPQATFRETSQGPKWVVMLDEFNTSSRNSGSHGKMVNVPGSDDKEPLNLGEYLSQMVNSHEGWRIAALLPGGTDRVIVVLQKQNAVVLPDPTPLKKATEVDAPTDPELKQVEDAALNFMKEEGLTADAPVMDDTRGEGIGLIPVDGSTVDVEESGAIVARSGALVQHSLELNQGTTVQAPNVPQPPATEEGIAMGVENIRQGLKNVLDGPDFGEV